MSFQPTTSHRAERPLSRLLKIAGVCLLSVSVFTPQLHAATPAFDLVKLINEYRQQNGLPPIKLSLKLTKVAMVHVDDLVQNEPHTKLCAAANKKSNLHSWSNNPPHWRGGCFDLDDSNTHGIMWSKPREIADYPGNGFEISASGGSSAQDALNIWKKSPAHNDVILNKDIWKNMPWKAIGAAMGNGYAHVWFGEQADDSKQIVFKAEELEQALYDRSAANPDSRLDLDALIKAGRVKVTPGKNSEKGNGNLIDPGNVTLGDRNLSNLANPSTAGVGAHGRVIGLAEDGKLLGIVAGAQIELKNQAGTVVAQVTAGQDGTYRINLAPGTYYYKITAEGYKDEDAGRGFTLQNSGGRSIYNFSLTEGENDPNRKPPEIETVELGKLKGKVLEGAADTEHVGIPGAVIALRSGKTRKLLRVVSRRETDNAQLNGAYELVLEAGDWRVSVSAPGFETLVVAEPIHIDLDRETDRDFVLSRLVPKPPADQGIIAEVTVNATRRDVTPPKQIDVEFTDLASGQKVDPTETLENPRQFTRDLSTGAYRVVARAEGYRAASSGPAYVFPGSYTNVKLTLVPEEAAPEVPPEEEPPKEDPPEEEPAVPAWILMVEVYEGKPGSARPLPEAKVLVRREGQALRSAVRGTTGEGGKTELQLQEPGSYTALAQKPNYQPGGQTIRINEEGSTLVKIYLSKTGPEIEQQDPEDDPKDPEIEIEQTNLIGYVVYKDTHSATGFYGIKEAKISFKPIRPEGKQPLYQATSGRIGDFKLTLPEGDYRVEIAPPAGFVERAETVNVAFGMKPKHFVLTRKRTVEPPPEDQPVDVNGVVVTSSSRSRLQRFTSVSGANVRWTRQAVGGVSVSRMSNTRGQFSLQLLEGRYTVAVRPPRGYNGLERVIDVYRGMPQPQLVLTRMVPGTSDERPGELDPSTNIPKLTLKVYGKSGGGQLHQLSGAAIEILSNGRQAAPSTTSDRNGQVSIPLRSGPYQVTVSHQGYSTARVNVNVPRRDFTQNIILNEDEGPGKPPPTVQPKRLLLQVVDGRTNRPLSADVRVVLGPGQFRTGKADRAGRYTTTLKPGSYQVQVHKSGYKDRGQDFRIAGGDVTLRVSLQPVTKPGGGGASGGNSPPPTVQPRRLNLQVIDKHTNRPLPANVRIVLGPGQFRTGTADKGGRYSVTLKPGSYQVQVGYPNYKFHSQGFVIKNADVNLKAVLELERIIR